MNDTKLKPSFVWFRFTTGSQSLTCETRQIFGAKIVL